MDGIPIKRIQEELHCKEKSIFILYSIHNFLTHHGHTDSIKAGTNSIKNEIIKTPTHLTKQAARGQQKN